MGIWELLFLAVGLSMDAFAVAICTGLTLKTVSLKRMMIVGLYFGIFQAGMPILGYLAATLFADYIIDYDHWIAFALLGFLGGKMILGSLKKQDNAEGGNEGTGGIDCAHPDDVSPSHNPAPALRPAKMLPMALATSIDALAVGVSFAFLQVRIAPAVSLIGVITLALSMAGVKIGHRFGAKFKTKAELAGGVILILIGAKILVEHLFLA